MALVWVAHGPWRGLERTTYALGPSAKRSSNCVCREAAGRLQAGSGAPWPGGMVAAFATRIREGAASAGQGRRRSNGLAECGAGGRRLGLVDGTRVCNGCRVVPPCGPGAESGKREAPGSRIVQAPFGTDSVFAVPLAGAVRPVRCQTARSFALQGGRGGRGTGSLTDAGLLKMRPATAKGRRRGRARRREPPLARGERLSAGLFLGGVAALRDRCSLALTGRSGGGRAGQGYEGQAGVARRIHFQTICSCSFYTAMRHVAHEHAIGNHSRNRVSGCNAQSPIQGVDHRCHGQLCPPAS